MQPLNTAIGILLLAVCVSVSAQQAAPAAVDIKRSINIRTPPPAELAGKRIYIVFDGSPRMTEIIRAKLKERGLLVTDSEGDAETTFKLTGVFSIEGAGKERVSGPLSELLEKTIPVDPSGRPDYQHQNVDLVQIATVTTFTGFLSVTDLGVWLSQKMGIAGRFNEMLTGDPRGFCWHESCNKYSSSAVLRVKGDDSYWWLQEAAKDERIVLDLVVEDILANGLKPLLDLKPESQERKAP